LTKHAFPTVFSETHHPLSGGIVRKVIPLLALVGFAAACGDGPTSSGDPLTQAQAQELAGVIIANSFPSGPALSPAAASGAESATITQTIDVSGPCPGGGTIAFKGSNNADVAADQSSATLSYDYTLTHNSCVATGENGTVFTLNGDPNVHATGTINYDQQTGFDGSLNYDGGVEWAAGDMSGSCQIDLSANVSFTTGSGSASVSGNVCGFSISVSSSISS